jgi:acrylyl-CoA reductase (NADPH)/3-hydroxypropionyl-CoA dehydratase/3-hydroxypropionyl-CoA synthetase
VLGGRGAATAIIFEGDRWDPSRNDGRGGPVFEQHVSYYRDLLLETVLRARVLTDLGLSRGDRIAFNLPNILEQIYYTEAAKRLGIIYTPVFGGFSAKTLSDRIYDAGARVVVTADGGYRNAEVVSYKESFTDQALDNFIPLPSALAALDRVLERFELGDGRRRPARCRRGGPARRDHHRAQRLMRELGAALADKADLSAELTAELRTTVARELAGVQHTVEQVVVVRYTGQDIVSRGATAGPRTWSAAPRIPSSRTCALPAWRWTISTPCADSTTRRSGSALNAAAPGAASAR